MSKMAAYYFPHIDGLRALAVLSVMVYHLSPNLLPGGFVGVDIFFVISGFVVTSSLAGHKGESLASFLASFYARRLSRIAPALLVMLLVTTIAYVLLVPKAWLGYSIQFVAQAAFWGVSNWALGAGGDSYFEPRAEFNPYTHTWSLGVEEQFYLIAPVLLFGWVTRRNQPHGQWPWVAAMGMLAFFSLAWTMRTASYYGPQVVFYPLVFRFWELGVGVLWYQWTAHRQVSSPRFDRLWSLAPWCGIVLVIATLIGTTAETFPWPWALGAVCGSMLLIGDPRRTATDRVRSFFARASLVWIGQRSYSLYLWHWPVFVIFRWTVGLDDWHVRLAALALAAILAFASYQWIENPCRTSAWLRGVPAGRRVFGFLFIILICWGSARFLLERQEQFGLSQVAKNAEDWYVGERMTHFPRVTRRCEPQIARRKISSLQVTIYLAETCNLPEKARIFVLGDSHAEAYAPMLDQLSAAQGRDIYLYSASGCPYLDLIEPMDHSRGPRCLSASRAAIADVLAKARPGDYIFLSSLRLPRLVEAWGHNHEAKDDEDSRSVDFQRSRTARALISAAVDDAPQWLEPFVDAGLRVVFEAPKPIFRVPIFRCVDIFNRINPICRNGTTETRLDEEAYRAPTLNALDALAARYPEIYIWDPLPVLCDSERCDAFRKGRPLFFDADHISAYGNYILFESFAKFLESLENIPVPDHQRHRRLPSEASPVAVGNIFRG